MRKLIISFVVLITMLISVSAVAANDAITLKIKTDGNVRAYQENVITIETTRAGELTLSVYDKYNEYTTICADYPIHTGTNTLSWDGLKADGAHLDAGKYSFRALLKTAEGDAERNVVFKMGRTRQAVICALRSSAINDRSGDWYAEVKLIRKGTLITEFYRADNLEEPFYTHQKQINNYRVCKWEWEGKVKGEPLPAGDYVLRFYAKETPRYIIDVPVTLVDEKKTVPDVAVTGAIMPDADATDEEIWTLMTQPAVVVDLKSKSHQYVYEKADPYSSKLGTLHGQSQSVEVTEITENGWAKINAWRHEDGAPITGYVPLERLKVVMPQDDYGLLIDKQQQTLTVFEKGVRIGTVSISTGLPERGHIEHETPAGSYLTLEHMEDYGMNGKRYQYVIRYDGGNLLHSIAYQPRGNQKDYSLQTATIGRKASNGCLRLPNMPNETGIDAFWIYTNIPTHTRVIILDDPAEREAAIQSIQNK